MRPPPWQRALSVFARERSQELEEIMPEHANDAAQAWSIDAYGAAEDLTLRPRRLPTPTGSQVLVRVEAAALNPLDLKLIGGAMAQFMPVVFPFTPGSDVCGEIVAMGPDAVALAIGDRVTAKSFAHGAMASHVLCDAGGAVVRVPAGTSSTTMAALPEAGMTALAVFRAAQVKVGMSVAVLGATGGIGLLVCQMAARAGARVIATASGAEDEELVRSSGATATLDYHKGDAVEALRAMHPDGIDVVIDLINQFDALLATAKAVRSCGALVSTLMGPEQAAFGDALEVRYIRLRPSAEDLAEVVRGVDEGWLVPHVSKTFPFAQVPEAYAEMRDGHVRGKIVVEVG